MPDQDIEQFIEKLKSNKELGSYSEDRVKQGVILPLLRLLGWDPFNVDEVTPEYTAGNGRVDYSLRIKSKNLFFIEAKKQAKS